MFPAAIKPSIRPTKVNCRLTAPNMNRGVHILNSILGSKSGGEHTRLSGLERLYSQMPFKVSCKDGGR